MVLTNCKKLFAAANVDAIYTECEFLMRYATGMGPENGGVLIDKDGATLYTDSRYIEAAKKFFEGSDVVPVLWGGKKLTEILGAYQRVGISYSQTSHARFLALQKSGAEFVDVDTVFTESMIVKNEWELGNIARACSIAEDALNMLLPEIREGMTETALAAQLEYNMRKLGAQGLAFETIVAFGANAAVPHHETGLTTLKFGDEILVDFGCRVNGYCSDITRTFLFGDDGKHEEFKKAYSHVLRAHELVQERAVSGMTGMQVDAIARDYLQANGYGELFTHSLGHGVGLNIHEAPSVSVRGEKTLADGMVFSDEPGVYVEGEYGIRIEDTVVLQDGKIKTFMGKTRKDLLIL
ncbi:MAG: aminopeptidase P family protein [Clostridia bacterium]|nr:aminopeptidase P family protein [Clostridia bacterium]